MKHKITLQMQTQMLICFRFLFITPKLFLKNIKLNTIGFGDKLFDIVFKFFLIW